MRRLLISFMILGLMAGSLATAHATKDPPGRVRTVEGSYDAPFVYFVSTCSQSGGMGCVSIATGPRETRLTAKVTDAHGQPVSVHVQANTQNDVLGDEITFGTFCGHTTEPISFRAGVELEFYVGVPDADCLPGIATTGTLSVSLSQPRSRIGRL